MCAGPPNRFARPPHPIHDDDALDYASTPPFRVNRRTFRRECRCLTTVQRSGRFGRRFGCAGRRIRRTDQSTGSRRSAHRPNSHSTRRDDQRIGTRGHRTRSKLANRLSIAIADAFNDRHSAGTRDHRTGHSSRRFGLSGYFSSWRGRRPFLFVHPTCLIDPPTAAKEKFIAAGDEGGSPSDGLTVPVDAYDRLGRRDHRARRV